MKDSLEPRKRYGLSGRLGTVAAAVFGLVSALLGIAGVRRLDADLSFDLGLLVYGLLAIFFTVAWRWLFQHAAELDKKVPVSQRERRKRSKEFDDWINSLGPR